MMHALWRWAVRSHGNKGKRWISRRYWQPQETRNWVFTAEYVGENGEPRPIRLLKASKTPIQRHVKIKSEANPYDPAWEPYLEERLVWRLEGTLAGRSRPKPHGCSAALERCRYEYMDTVVFQVATPVHEDRTAQIAQGSLDVPDCPR